MNPGKERMLEAYGDYCGEQKWEPLPDLAARKELNNRMLELFGSVERKAPAAATTSAAIPTWDSKNRSRMKQPPAKRIPKLVVSIERLTEAVALKDPGTDLHGIESGTVGTLGTGESHSAGPEKKNIS